MKLVNRVVVTGGAGFIGSNLVDRLLAEGYSVDVVDDLSTGSLLNLREARTQGDGKFSFFQASVVGDEFQEIISVRQPKCIFHLAAQADVRKSMADPVYDAEVNLLGSIRVLDAARTNSVQKVIYAASGGTLYGELPTRLECFAESDRGELPDSFYGISKALVLDYLDGYRKAFDLEYSALALGNVYGPRQDPNGEAGVVSIFFSKMRQGQATTIFGDGTQTRDFVFVDDVVDAFVRALDSGGGLVMNVGANASTSILDLHKLQSELSNYTKEPIFAPARSGELMHSRLDNTLARVHLGWQPWTPLGEGLSKTLAYFKATLG